MLGAVGYDGPDVAVAVDPQSVRGVSGRKRVTCGGDTGFSALVPDRIDTVRIAPDRIGVNGVVERNSRLIARRLSRDEMHSNGESH